MSFDGAKLAIYAGIAIVVSVLAYKAYDAIGDAREAKVVARYEKIVADEKEKNRAKEEGWKIEKATLEAKLEGKNDATENLANTLRDQLSNTRLCLNAVRARPVPTDPIAATVSNGSPERPEPAENLGQAATRIFEECQRSTDKLITLQSWLTSTGNTSH